MRYLDVDDAIKFEDEKITECRAVKIFYVIYGRNAWNDTWITRYFDGCMNPSIASAKATAERRRVQGSVFSISEVPALQFIADTVSLLITEINTDQPFQYVQAFQEKQPLNTKTIYDHFTPKKENSIIRLISAKSYDQLELDEIAAGSIFKKIKSYSHGKGYRLGWRDIDHKMSSNAVANLTVQFNNIISAN